MSYLDKLLEGVEVEWIAFGDVIFSLKTGLNPRQNFQLNTVDAKGYYVTVREIQNGQIVFLNNTDRVNEHALKLINNRSNLDAGDVLFTGTGTVGRTSLIKIKPLNWNVKEGVYVIKPNPTLIDSGYLSYLLNSSEIVKEYSKKIVGSPVISLPMSELKKLPIPLPSLSVQKEIVRILDTFTELAAELIVELTARKQQYNYYREKLLSFEEGDVEWKTLGEVAEIKRGKRLVKSQLEETGKYAVFQNSMTPLGYYHENNVQADTTFIISAGSAGEIGYSSIDFWAADDVYYFVTPKTLKSKFVYYFLLTQQIKITGQVRRASVPRLSKTSFEKMQIPVPRLEEQERIVSILDKFDILTTSISEGLPKEIELRKKQYEYYRDLLLTFNK